MDKVMGSVANIFNSVIEKLVGFLEGIGKKPNQNPQTTQDNTTTQPSVQPQPEQQPVSSSQNVSEQPKQESEPTKVTDNQG